MRNNELHSESDRRCLTFKPHRADSQESIFLGHKSSPSSSSSSETLELGSDERTDADEIAMQQVNRAGFNCELSPELLLGLGVRASFRPSASVRPRPYSFFHV